MKPLVAPLLLALALPGLFASGALAQEPTMLFQSPWPLAPNPQLATPSLLLMGEPSQAGTLSPWVASIPLRLSLQGGIFPMAGAFPNCAPLGEGSGNSFQGWAVQRYALVSTLPNLTLHGFSSAGCPIDGAIGGGVTYSAPLGKDWWLVGSGGLYGVPAHGALPTRRRDDVRLDLMKAAPDGRMLGVGIGRRGVSFGGSF
jgi:hypothetical protein